MRKKLEKLISIVSILMFFVVSMSTKEVHASDSTEWNIKINQIGDAKRSYFNDRFTFLPENMQKSSISVNVYNINTKEVTIQAERINQGTYIYVSVDDHYVGNADENLIDYTGDTSLNYTTFVVKNLTPGTHKIEVKADSPDYMSTAQKRDIVYVNMLPYEDEEIDKSIADIKNGTANLYDYEVVGVGVVNGTNLQAVNDLIKGQDLDPSNVQNTIIQIVNQANNQVKLKNAFTRINSGLGTINDYTEIGVVNVTSSNLNAINAEVKSIRDAKQVDLTKDEIQNVVDNLPNMINDANTRISAGTAALLDYTLVGVTGVTSINLPDVNDYVKGKDNSTLSKLQANVNTMVTALTYINNGNAGITYYTTLGITTVIADNIVTINKSIITAKNAKGNNLTKSEIVQVVQDTLVNIANANARINSGTATLADYMLIGITGVTSINLADINDYVKGKDNSTLSKLQANVNTMVTALTYINNGNAGTTYYATLGITTVTADNIATMNKSMIAAKTAKGNNLTKSEIVQVVQDTLVNIANANGGINAGTATLADYTLIGITGVTSINLSDINDYVKGKDNSTLSKLQTNVNTMVTALNYINNGNAGTTYYTTLGITTVTADNIATMNKSMIAAKTAKGNNLTKSEIQKVVSDTLVSIADTNARINAGTATLADYTLIGITGVTALNLADVNDYVKGKDNSTLSKLQTNVTNIANALYYISQGSTSITYYTTLGITTVTSDNSVAISKNIVVAKNAKGNNLTKAEIQKIVSDTLVSIASAYTRINAGTATLADYTLIGITGVTALNLADVNDYVKGKDNSTLSKLQTNVTNIANALYFISQGSTSITYYTTLGITTVTASNISVISKNVVTAKNAKGGNLTKSEIVKVVQDTLKV
jgi:uncharacterized protein YqfB (UPF0267 family)